MDKEKKVYLTIHGHFYQPPRENPWLEYVEQQDSASPAHDWNTRVAQECYTPNSVSKIVDYKNRILDIVNNYSLMSFNFGPTLLSWLEKFAPYTYERIIKADMDSCARFKGHGNAIAQVYNHIIMPLANERDKYTQVIWGIKDFQTRFARMPEGIWLAETATDEDTLEVLMDLGLKFTVLSPYQAAKVRKIGEEEWKDVSWGNIDPGCAYKYFSKKNPKKFIYLFFYDGSISKSVAFDELLKDGNKFISRLKDGISDDRPYNQLVNIATDGESYGHHTKFGDMALSYVLKIRAENEGFEITNYGKYLEDEPVENEVQIKPVSSWSCAHGVGRWCDDCGCSTGGNYGWNQKWRKPLRESLNYLRDKFTQIYEEKMSEYTPDWDNVRNNYISVILDRNETDKFFEDNFDKQLDKADKITILKLLELQRQSLLMFTSCGWFFTEISGIETVQILKYAARGLQLAQEFTSEDIETEFLKMLSEAQSNIKEFGNGADVYNRFVRPSIVSIKQIAALWAISSLFEEYDKTVKLYCYKITCLAYKKLSKGKNSFIVARIEVQSLITQEKFDFAITTLQYSEVDFHCAMKEFNSASDFTKLSKDLCEVYTNGTFTEVIRKLDEVFGHDYYNLRDVLVEDRRKILNSLIVSKRRKFADSYKQAYQDNKASMLSFIELGLDVPEEYKLSARFTLSLEFNKIFRDAELDLAEEKPMLKAKEIISEAKTFNITIDKTFTEKFFAEKLLKRMRKFIKVFDSHTLETVFDLFKYIEELELKSDLSEAQNLYFAKIYSVFPEVMEKTIKSTQDNKQARKILNDLLELGTKLNINTEYYSAEVLRATVAEE
ncbi:DUF3536 domain-containing protein [bacterium]|nr:DUF3536 domain-containing protein [bacterium]